VQTAIVETQLAEESVDTQIQTITDVIHTGKIAFESGTDGALGDLYVINEDGSGLKKLVDRQEFGFDHCGHPSWSPDGSQLAFATLTGSNWEIWLINTDGSGAVKIEGTQGGMDPSWSPDGTKIAFVVWDNHSEIYTINIDGSGLARLTDNDARDADPSWSPDGSQIVFSSNRDGSDSELYIVNADGGKVIQLTNNNIDEWDPSWSPDGLQIAYLYDRGPSAYTEIRIIDRDSLIETQVTSALTYSDLNANSGLCWSPDSVKLALISHGRIYSIEVEGNGTIQIIYIGDKFTLNPSWCP
jgi:Tol biopolymer transport system component